MKIWLTGATGMVGKNVLDAFKLSAHEILSPTRAQLNLFDEIAILEFLQQTKPDLIIHCAGRVGGIQANIEDPLSFFIENLDAGRNVVMAAYKAGVSRLINLASSCMYPRNATNPLKEQQILTGELEPTNEGYALAKIAIQRLCNYISKKDAYFKYKTLIPCNLYGRYDKFDIKRAHLIPAVIRKIHEAKQNHLPSVDIWGDGSARREFLFASDLADFILKKLPFFDQWPDVMNVGAVVDHTITEYYQTVASVLGYHGIFEYDFSKPVGMMRKLADSKHQQSLGWIPPTSLEKGIQLTYEFYLNSQLAVET